MTTAKRPQLHDLNDLSNGTSMTTAKRPQQRDLNDHSNTTSASRPQRPQQRDLSDLTNTTSAKRGGTLPSTTNVLIRRQPRRPLLHFLLPLFLLSALDRKKRNWQTRIVIGKHSNPPFGTYTNTTSCIVFVVLPKRQHYFTTLDNIKKETKLWQYLSTYLGCLFYETTLACWRKWKLCFSLFCKTIYQIFKNMGFTNIKTNMAYFKQMLVLNVVLPPLVPFIKELHGSAEAFRKWILKYSTAGCMTFCSNGTYSIWQLLVDMLPLNML